MDELPRRRSLDVLLTLWIAVGTLFFFRQFWEAGRPVLAPVLARLFGRS